MMRYKIKSKKLKSELLIMIIKLIFIVSLGLEDIIEEGPFPYCGEHIFNCWNCGCGEWFSDESIAIEGGFPTQIKASYGDDPYNDPVDTIVRGIQFTYGNLSGTYHGAHSDDLAEEVCNLNPGERILRIHGSTQPYRSELRSSEWIQRIEFDTTSQICGPYGGEIGAKTIEPTFNGCNLFYISGTVMGAHKTISAITFHWKCDNSTTVSVF